MRKAPGLAAVVAWFSLVTPVEAQVRFDERVDVARVLVDVRVTDAGGRPVRGLTASAFQVDLDGKSARVESATWIGLPPAGRSPAVPGAGPPGAGTAVQPSIIPRGRLLVFLFQHSLEPSRIGGLLRMMAESSRFVDRLQPGDRAAIVVFDTRLRVWQDFTANTAVLKGVLARGVVLAPASDVPADDVSLSASLDPRQASRAATPEAALEALGAALAKIEGPKSIALFGYGFGTFRSVPGLLVGRAELGPDYDRARAALVGAQATVFAMDVTDAEEHTLQAGLMVAAEDTGGFYVRTHEFHSAALDRLGGALEGYYLLAVETTGGERRRSVRVRVTTPGATVLVRRFSSE